jgi:ribosomal protein S6
MAAESVAGQARLREYETIYVLKPDVTAESAAKIANRVEEVVTREAGKLTLVETWGRRQLAYPVTKFKRGVYLYVKYLGKGGIVTELERNLKMLDDVLNAPEQMERVVMQLLAKNPAERFPNTQVLARHLQAMVKALSRPAADDFALASEPHVVDPLDGVQDHLVNAEVTQVEVPSDRPSTAQQANAGNRSVNADSHDAATLAADDGVTGPPPPSPLTQAAAAQPIASITAPRAASAASRFTTVEEDEARRRAESQRSWIVIAGQLAALVMVLGAMGTLALYLSQPPSADALYQTIKKKGIADDDASVANVEREIEQFLRRFPADLRAAELTKYREQLTLDRAERRLQRDARAGGSANAQLLPAERLYVQALDLAESDPDAAIARLRSLADLYGPTVPVTDGSNSPEIDNNGQTVTNPDPRVVTIVQLAERKLDALQHDLANQREAELAALQERLDAAQRLATTDAPRATAIYRAIIDLHLNDTWAGHIVKEAQKRLTELKPKSHEP